MTSSDCARLPAGESFDLHCDFPFLRQTRDRVHTTWIAFGDIRVEIGPLFIVERSGGNEVLVDTALSTRDVYPPGEDPAVFVETHDTRLLIGDIEVSET